jgi:hypothetical protein
VPAQPRSQGSIALLALALLALGPAVTQALQRYVPAQLQVLEQSDLRTVVRASWPADSIPDWSTSFAVAVPGAHGVTARAVSLQTEPATAEVVDEWGAAFAMSDDDRRPGVQPLASAPFSISPPRRFRGVWIVNVDVHALHRPQGAVPLVVRELVVQIDHPPSAGRATRLGLGAAGAPPGEPAAQWPADAVINPAAARHFVQEQGERRAPAPAAPAAINDTFARSDRWLRVEVVRTGVYAVTYADLDLLAGNADLIDPASFRLLAAPTPYQPELPEDPRGSWTDGYELVERALLVEASGPLLHAGDRVLFYAPGPEEWSDRYDPTAGLRDHLEHEFSDRLAYWLTWDVQGSAPGTFTAAPLRMQLLDGSSVGSATRDVLSHRERLHVERNLTPAFGEVRDNWLWEPRIATNQELGFAFAPDTVIPDSTGWLYTEPFAEPPTPPRGYVTPPFSAQYHTRAGPLGTAAWSLEDQNSLLRNPPFRMYFGGYHAHEGLDTLWVKNTTAYAGPPGSTLYPTQLKMDFFSVTYRRGLTLRAGELAWVVFADEAAQPERARFLIGNVSAWPTTRYVLDTTDPHRPKRVLDGDVISGGSVLQMELDLTPLERRDFVAVVAGAVRRPDRMRVRRPRLLRSEIAAVGGVDYLALAPAELMPAAEDLAQLRRQSLSGRQGLALSTPRATAVDLQDVYDNFGHGVKEPAAIRNFLKFVYEHPDPGDPSRRLLYAAFLGDGSRDYRNRAARDPSGSEIDRCPTFIQTLWPSSFFQGYVQNRPYAADDWLGCMDDHPPAQTNFEWFIDLPEVATGRLPAANLAEARAMVDRIVAYETAPAAGAWRNSVLMVADDDVCLAFDNCSCEDYHITEAELIAEGRGVRPPLLPQELDVSKLYLTNFPVVPGTRAKPTARAAMRNAWSEGQLIVHYIGHGSPEQMADEAVFRIEDVTALTNAGRRPLFLAFSCDVSIFDDNAVKSMSEKLVLSDGGGAIGTIAATQVTYVGPNETLTNAFYPLLFPGAIAGRSVPVGLALLLAKISSAGSSSLNQHNGQKYVLLGDPAMRLESPSAQLALTDSLLATLDSGHLLQVEAQVQQGGAPRTDFTGRYDLEVRAARDHSGYLMSSCPVPGARIDYAIDGAAIFHGTGTVTAGKVTAELLVPTAMAFGTDGRLRLLAESGNEQVVALKEPMPARRVTSQSQDAAGPRITLAFENAGKDGAVLPGAVMTAGLDDPSGINVQARSPASAITLEIDSSDIATDVTSAFALDDGRFDRGSLRFTLPQDITAGKHTATLRASDMVGNVGTATLAFTVVQVGGEPQITMLPFPNPFAESTRFVMEGPATDLTTVELRIFALDGTPVRTLREEVLSPGQIVIGWDGRDALGDEIANGVYLYTVRASLRAATSSAAPEPTLTSSGRVVRMR